MDNSYFNILGHATGRLIGHREPYDLDIEKIIYNAKDKNCCLEINSQPYRMDLTDTYCKTAKDIGVKFAVSTDAHTLNGLNYMTLGINIARRAWLEKKDIINTYSLQKLLKVLKK